MVRKLDIKNNINETIKRMKSAELKSVWDRLQISDYFSLPQITKRLKYVLVERESKTLIRSF